MIVVEFEKDVVYDILRVTKWEFITKQASLNIKNIEGYRRKFDSSDVPTDFYKHPKEYFLDSTKLRRFYVKK